MPELSIMPVDEARKRLYRVAWKRFALFSLVPTTIVCGLIALGLGTFNEVPLTTLNFLAVWLAGPLGVLLFHRLVFWPRDREDIDHRIDLLSRFRSLEQQRKQEEAEEGGT